MKKSEKFKKAAYSLNMFAFGLTGASLIPAGVQPTIAWVSLAVILTMLFVDWLTKPVPPSKTGKARKVATKKEKPPRKKKRRRK